MDIELSKPMLRAELETDLKRFEWCSLYCFTCHNNYDNIYYSIYCAYQLSLQQVYIIPIHVFITSDYTNNGYCAREQ